jgi:hypothetical protein
MTENEISFKIREQYSKFTHPGPGLFESHMKVHCIWINKIGIESWEAQLRSQFLWWNNSLTLPLELISLVEKSLLNKTALIYSIHFKQVTNYLKLTNKSLAYLSTSGLQPIFLNDIKELPIRCS